MRALYKPIFQIFQDFFLFYFIILGLFPTLINAKRIQAQNTSESPQKNKSEYILPFKPCTLQIPFEYAVEKLASDNVSNIYISNSKGLIKSFNIKDGNMNWETDLNLEINSNIEVDRKNVYFSTKTNKTGNISKVRAISKQTGIINWQKDISGSTDVTLRNFENLLVQTELETNFLNNKDGSTLWKSENNIPIQTPLDFDNSLESENDRKLKDYIEANSETIINLSNKNRIESGKITTIFFNGDIIILGDTLGNIQAFGINSRKKLWSGKNGGRITSFSLIEEDKVLVSSLDNFLYLFDIKNGNLVWKRRFGYRLINKPTIKDEIIIVSEINGNNVSIIENRSGKVLNQINLPENYFISENSIIIAERIVIPTNRGILLYSRIPC